MKKKNTDNLSKEINLHQSLISGIGKVHACISLKLCITKFPKIVLCIEKPDFYLESRHTHYFLVPCYDKQFHVN